MIDKHSKILRQFDEIQTNTLPTRLECLKNRRMVNVTGASWEELGERFNNKPRFEIPKTKLSIMRILGEYRQNRISVNFEPKANQSDISSDILDGMFRDCEQASNANEAYDTAFEEMLSGGFGAWRLSADYENEESTKMTVKILPIPDADSTVYFDQQSKRADKEDARYVYILTGYTPDAYRDAFGQEPRSVDKTVTLCHFDWFTSELYYVAEYYEKETVPAYIYRLEDDSTLYTTEKQPYELIRKTTKTQIRKYIVDGNGIIDSYVIAGKHLPVVAVYGYRSYIDGTERISGHAAMARDAQILKNIELSTLAEIAIKSPISKPVVTTSQIAGHEHIWASDIVEDRAYLTINPTVNENGIELPPQGLPYIKPPEIPQALAGVLTQVDADLTDILGKSVAIQQGNQSGYAIELLAQKFDAQTYLYMSNLQESMKRCGTIWLSMARETYIEQNREVRLRQSDGTTLFENINVPQIPTLEGMQLSNALSSADFDVIVSVGTSSSTKRQATVKNIASMLPVVNDQAMQSVLASVAIMNMEGEGLSDLRDYMRKTLVMQGIIKPNEEELAQIQQQSGQLTAEQQYLQSLTNEANAKALKTQSDQALNITKAEKTRAETLDIIANTNIKEQEQALKILDKLVDDPTLPVGGFPINQNR